MNLSTRISIDARSKYPVEEKVFGHFIEHLGRCIKYGIWDERATDEESEFGRVRKDVFEAMKALKPPVIRWPGGCFADTYRWQDGIGPEPGRRKRINKAWWWLKPSETMTEDNHFGTDEFIELCSRMGAEPYINISFGAGSVQDAADWVEYCNGETGTKGGDLRAENGHEKPYNVPYWGIGNELWGPYESGYCINGRQYARRYFPFFNAMKSVDESIRTVAVGANRTFRRWNKDFLWHAAHCTEYLSLHEYIPGVNPLNPAAFFGYPDTEKAYYSMLAGADYFRDSILWFRETIEKSIGPDSDIKISFDEWNAWWRYRQIIRSEDYTMREGLMTACTLSYLVKLSKIVGMANFAQFVNVLGLIITHRDGIYMTPSYYTFKLYRDHVLDDVLETGVECETIETAKNGFIKARKAMPLVEALATKKRRGKLVSVIAVNKHISEPQSAEISFSGFKPGKKFEMRRICSDSPYDRNSMNEPDKITITESSEKSGKAGIRVTLPPHSVTQFTFRGE